MLRHPSRKARGKMLCARIPAFKAARHVLLRRQRLPGTPGAIPPVALSEQTVSGRRLAAEPNPRHERGMRYTAD
jgi:hypothetical protein